MDLGRPASCKEIATLTRRKNESTLKSHVETVSDRHVNWVLKDVPELARRLERKGQSVHYEIVPAGRKYVELVGRNV